MTDLDCYVEAVAQGSILGIDRHWSPADVDALLGAEGHDGLNLSATGRWRDYGLAEISWQRPSLAHHWTGNHLTLQLHRLVADWCHPNDMLRARHGDFRPHMQFEDLHAALDARDIPLVELPDVDHDYLRYRQPDSGSEILVLNHDPEPDPDYPRQRRGDVYHISSGRGPAHAALPGTAWKDLGEALSTVPDEPRRPEWLSAQEPDEPMRPRWWNALFSHLTREFSPAGPLDPAKVELFLWFAREALTRSVDVVEVALSELTNLTEHLGFPPSGGSTPGSLSLSSRTLSSRTTGSPAPGSHAEVFPTPDEIVRHALAAVPLTPAQTRWSDPTLRGQDLPDQLRTRALIALAARHHRRLTDPSLRAALAPWLTLWPELR